MNRNSNTRFSVAPQVNCERSTFDRSNSVKTSFNLGEIIPFYLEEILPGDTYKVKTAKIARMQTLKTPMMDNVFLDTYYFFVPNRLIWNHWKQFCGENTESAWIPETEYNVPKIAAPSGGWTTGTVADYMGIPTGKNLTVNAMPIRAYALICNEWFRDENNSDPLVIETGDSTVNGSNGNSFVTDVAKGGKPYIAAKTHDYFTSCLPAPQKGPDVQVSAIGNKTVPVYTTAQPNQHYYKAGMTQTQYNQNIADTYPLMYEYGIPTWNAGIPNPAVQQTSAPTAASDTWKSGYLSGASSTQQYKTVVQSSYDGTHPNNNLDLGEYIEDGKGALTPVNLVAENALVYTSINELRQAFQIQRFYEKCARGGTRYIEMIKSHFGVTSPDARMQRPEYLGGNRLPLNVKQITQTSSTTSTSPMGDVSGMSVTTDNHNDFTKSFTEHGYIIGVCVARIDHTYQQGLERLWSRNTLFDFYWPSFAHIGEQAVLNKEIYAQGSIADTPDDEVFGYQEAWADYRYKPNRVTGQMRSQANTALDTWHMADNYNSLPYLSSSWIMEDKSNLDRCLAVSSNVSNQIFADIYVKCKATRPLPLYSIPGLIDHY